MSFSDAEQYLNSLGIDAMKKASPSLQRIQAICDALGHPEQAVPALHVTGTNGKTSVARIASALLGATGLTVGTYTSPHLQSVRERIALAGEPISEDEFAALFEHLRPYIDFVQAELGETLTFFEVLTAMFFLWAAEHPVDVAVIEVGLGGRWDATNVVQAPVSVITNVALDHMALLGGDAETIASEKSGIIKPGARVVTAERKPGVLEVIRAEAAQQGAEVSEIGRDFLLVDNRVALGGRFLSVRTSVREYNGLFLPLHGSHQATNAATALEATTRFLALPPSDEVVAEGFATSVVPGRLETVRTDRRPSLPVILDVAHNPDGMSALITSLIEAFAFDRVVFVLGILGDKDYRGMLQEIARVPCSIMVTEPQTVRSVPTSELLKVAKDIGLSAKGTSGVEAAVVAALAEAEDHDLVCVTGSHYVVGEARSFLSAGSIAAERGG
ncbi:MAG: dihydrofolate synthase / folylpolyglutamate synthase [Actinomycetota bacterium]|nr:dihydrofolate synthase / folylpolyglutamate synthase [Actinomycetota bacterium]